MDCCKPSKHTCSLLILLVQSQLVSHLQFHLNPHHKLPQQYSNLFQSLRSYPKVLNSKLLSTLLTSLKISLIIKFLSLQNQCQPINKFKSQKSSQGHYLLVSNQLKLINLHLLLNQLLLPIILFINNLNYIK
jgi:hypothetical protein